MSDVHVGRAVSRCQAALDLSASTLAEVEALHAEVRRMPGGSPFLGHSGDALDVAMDLHWALGTLRRMLEGRGS